MRAVAAGERAAVWIIIDFAPDKRGALEQNLLALAAGLRAADVETPIVFAGRPVDWIEAELRALHVATRILDFRRPLAAALELARWLRLAPPDLVHFHFVRAYSPLVLAAHAAGAKVIVHDHLILGKPIIAERTRAPALQRALQPAKRLRGVALNQLIDARIAPSLAVAVSVMDAEFFPSERIEVIPNGIDFARFATATSTIRAELGLGFRPVVACAVAQMRAEKGVEVLIRALSSIRADAALLVAGPPSAECRSLVERRGLQDNVHFLGLRNDVENVFAAADAIVVPSTCDEAFCFAAVEGMAAGKPVVVTDSGGMPELMAGGECGVVVPKHDADALAGAISAILSDDARAQRLGAAARERVAALYTTERWVAAILRAYQRLVPSIRLAPTTAEASGVTKVAPMSAAVAQRSAIA